MRSFASASDSWEELKRYRTLDDLKAIARIEGHSSPIASAGLRSAAWKAYLLFEDLDLASWPKTLAASRSAYDSLRMHFLSRLYDSNDSFGGNTESLSRSASGADDELRAEIKQDVDRCMQDNYYFREPETRRMLLDVLYVYSKLNPDTGYRQGMHEILAPVLWVVERDAIDLGLSSKTLGEASLVKAVFDADFIEHDSFALFSKIMQHAKSFYEQTTHSGKENPIVLRSQRIFNELLQQVDPILAKHLEKIDIVPQVFLIRWIRLLFGREFQFDDTLSVWDLIFAEDQSLELVDYISVAMLLRIRWELVAADYNEALTILLRYPEPDKVYPPQTFVTDALYMREHLNEEAGGYLVLKYTGRPARSSGRPTTPPALQRNITTFSGQNARTAISSAVQARPQRNIEALLQSTAKNIYTRGGQAVRSAVDEVHKRAQEIRETQTPRPPSRGYGPLYNRIKGLEQRNKDLSQLLEGAVKELWTFQKLASDHEAHKNGRENSTLDVEPLSVAIAKVQFVQVYLSDPSLALPTTDDPSEAAGASVPSRSLTPVEAHTNRNDDQKSDQVKRHLMDEESSLADPSTFDDLDAAEVEPTIPDQGKIEAEIHDAMQSRPPTRGADADKREHSWPSPNPKPHRPLLSESLYSWMLGNEDASAEPFRKGVIAPEQPRTEALFGDGDSADASETTVTKKQDKRKSATPRKQKTAAATGILGENILQS